MLVALFSCLIWPLASQTQTNQTPLIPSGNLSAFPAIVHAGTHPTLTWGAGSL